MLQKYSSRSGSQIDLPSRPRKKNRTAHTAACLPSSARRSDELLSSEAPGNIVFVCSLLYPLKESINPAWFNTLVIIDVSS